MKILILLSLLLTSLSYGLSWTDSYTESRDGIDTVRTITYYWTDKLVKVKKCINIIDTINEEVVLRKCSVIKK